MKKNIIKKSRNLFNYLNTIILMFIFGFSLMCFTNINQVKNIQEIQKTEFSINNQQIYYANQILYQHL